MCNLLYFKLKVGYMGKSNVTNGLRSFLIVCQNALDRLFWGKKLIKKRYLKFRRKKGLTWGNDCLPREKLIQQCFLNVIFSFSLLEHRNVPFSFLRILLPSLFLLLYHQALFLLLPRCHSIFFHLLLLNSSSTILIHFCLPLLLGRS